MSTKLIRRALLAALAIGIGGTSMLVSDEAEARGRRFEQQAYESGRPLKGFQGVLYSGHYRSYRPPVRICSYDARGRRVCRIKGS